MRKSLIALILGLATVPSWAEPAPEAQPLRYSQIVPLALERNVKLKSQGKNVDEARSRVDIAYAERNPTFGISSDYINQQRTLIRQLIPGNDGQLMLNSIGVSIPVYTGGRLESAMHERKALLEVEGHNLERNRQQLAFRSKEVFLQALLAREDEEVAKETLAEARETERQTLAGKKAGTRTKFDVMQAKVAVSSAEQQVVQSHTALQSAQANLANLLHYPVTTTFEMPDSLMAPVVELEPLAGTDLKSLTVLAIDRRPELASLRAQLKANDEATNGARSGMRPQFSLALNYALIGMPSDLAGGWQVIAQLSIPIWDGGVTAAKVGELDNRKDQLKLDEEAQVDQIALEVKQSLLNLEDAEARLLTAERQVEEAREAVRLARIRFKAGVGTSLELVTAQASFASAQYAFAEARYRQMDARAQLNLALSVATGVPESKSGGSKS